MDNSSTTAPSLYDNFGIGISSFLIQMVGIRWLTAMAGLILNATLVYVTIRNKNLHGNCNLFIATQAMFETLTMASFSISFFLVLTGRNFMPLGQCMAVICWGSFANFMRKVVLFMVSLDRLLMVSFPLLLGQKPLLFYGICVSIAAGYSVFANYLVWQSVLAPAITNRQVICTLSDLNDQTGPVGLFVSTNSLVLVGLAAVDYVLLWAILRWKTDGSENGKATRQYTRQIYKMLLILTSLAIFGWMLNPAVRLFIQNVNPVQKFSMSIGLSCITNTSMAMDPIVLYWFSKDYKNAFQKTFPRLLGFNQQQYFTKVVSLRQPPVNS